MSDSDTAGERKGLGVVVWISIGWLVLLATYGAWSIYYYCLRRYRPAVVSATIYLSPPLTMVWAWAMFGEPLTLGMGVGVVVTLAGLAMVARYEAPRPSEVGAPVAA